MIYYNKLVRDKIPQIIEAEGRIATRVTLSQEKYLVALDAKLNEEVAEYQKDQNLEELADILEVLHAICQAKGYTLEDLEALRAKKHDQRGGFQNRIYLESVT